MRTSLLSIFLFLLTFAQTQADNVVLVAGGGEAPEGSPAAQAKLNSPFGVEFDSAGNLFFIEIDGHRLCRIDKTGILTRIAGTGKKGLAGDGGQPLAAEFNAMHNLAITKNDDIYLADTLNHRVRKLDKKTGLISTIAGADKGFSGDGGSATAAKFSGIYCITLDPRGDRLLIADLDNRRIRAVDLKTNIVTTIAGNGEKGIPADGSSAANSPLVDPRAVTADASGNVYILERGGHALRVVDSQGKIRTVAGTGQKGATGDGGPALAATMNGPKHLCVDQDNNSIIIADTENHVIRKYTPADGKIVRLAGFGKKGTAGVGGPALEIELNQPHGVTLHKSGDLYISDATNHRILKLVRSK